jgi:hypothetical protein
MQGFWRVPAANAKNANQEQYGNTVTPFQAKRES